MLRAVIITYLKISARLNVARKKELILILTTAFNSAEHFQVDDIFMLTHVC